MSISALHPLRRQGGAVHAQCHRHHRVRLFVVAILCLVVLVTLVSPVRATSPPRSAPPTTTRHASTSRLNDDAKDIVAQARATAASARQRRAATVLSVVEDNEDETAAVAASSSVPSVDVNALKCPLGWAKLTASAAASSNFQCVRVVSAPAAFIVTPINTGDACAEAWSLFAPTAPDTHTIGGTLAQRDGWYYNYTNAPVVASAVHSSYQNEQLRAYLSEQDLADSAARFTAPDTVAIGGVAGFGSVDWFDGSVDEGDNEDPYTNFDATVPWRTSSGCIALHPSSGRWLLVDCHASYYPYVCGFALDQHVVAPTTPSGEGSSPSPITTTTAAPIVDASYALRPPVPTPVPACLEGWTPLPASVSSSHAHINSTQDGAMCYRLFAPAGAGVGLYGLPRDKAEAYCGTLHPTATLANVLSPEENDWLLWQVIRSSTVYPELVNAASGASRTVAIYLGGAFSLNGTLGRWSGDAYAYNDSASAFSSPAWPTPANRYYTHWGANQPLTSYGCLAMKVRAATEALESEGVWISQSCGSMQPFLCSYRNDGSTFDADGEGSNSTVSTTTTTTKVPEKGDFVCRTGWSLFGSRCYRVFRDVAIAASPAAWTSTADNDNDDEAGANGGGGSTRWDVISPSTLEGHCHASLYRTGSTKRNEAVHAAAILSVEDSLYVGELLAQTHSNWTAEGAAVAAVTNKNTTATIALDWSKALVGVSFRQRGNGGGLYLNGRYLLDPVLAQELWATREPTLRDGCVAIDEDGWWYAVPCDTVTYRAYVCEYYAPDVDPNDGDDDGSDPSGSTTTTTLPPSEKVPLAERVVSLADAVHLVVSADTVGVYTVQARTKAGDLVSASAAQTDGLLFLFSPVSPYYYTDLRDSTAVGRATQGHLLQPFQTTQQGVLLFNESGYAPCGSWKDQSRVFAVQGGHVTVQHVGHSEVGYVCVSEDGQHYVPTRITYEVVEAQMRGLVQIPTRSQTSAASSSISWLPPLFYTPEALTAAAANGSVEIMTKVPIERFSSGVLQVVGGVKRHFAPVHSSTGAKGTTDNTTHPVVASVLRRVRFASSPACLASDFYFANATIEVREVSSAYTVGQHNSSASAASVYALVYSGVDTAPTSLATVQRLSDRTEVPPVEYYVCVAVEKREATSLPWLDLFVQSNGSAAQTWPSLTAAELSAFYNVSSPTTASVAERIGRDRLMGTGSRTRANASMLVYTSVPGLKVFVTPPPVSLSGMWVLPPQPSAAPRVGLTPVAASTTRPAHYELFEVSGAEADEAEKKDAAAATRTTTTPVPSETVVRVGQYASPIIALDGSGLRAGMSLLLSREASWCGRVQPSAALPNGTVSSGSDKVPVSLDTMLAISTVNVQVRGDGVDAGHTHPLAFVQLTTNHTGMWGFNASDPAQQSLTWYVCYAYSPMTSYVALSPLRIIVDRLQITAITASRSGGVLATDTAAVASATAHLELNAGFSGLVHLWGLDVRYWASNTLQTAQITLAEVLPSSHLNDPTYQCANPSLFYQQTGLHLVPPSSSTAGHIGGTAANTSTSLVLSPGFLARESTGPMRVCLSIPQPFHAARRVFAPTDATVDVRPVALMYVGRYSAVTTGATVIEIAEDADEVFYPLTGYGLHADVVPFLSTQPCRPQKSASASAAYVPSIVQHQSVVNLTVVAPYDVPRNYWNTSASPPASSSSAVTEQPVYLLISKDVLTSQARADALYGPASTRAPLYMCLYVPETDEEVYTTAFQVIVKPPQVRQVRNLKQDASLVQEAMRHNAFPVTNGTDSAANATAIVVYAAYMDLLVEGFGLETSAPEMMPAVDCGNASSFLWTDPVKLSAMPSATGLSFSESERYVDKQTSTSSWYLSLSQAQTARLGADELHASDLLTRFQWCVRYTTRVNQTALATDPSAGFVAAGIPYQFVLPAVNGFRFGSAIAQYTQVPTQDKTLGQWQQYRLVGPVVDITYRMGNPLYLFLIPEAESCKAVKNAHLRDGTTDENILLAVNGSIVIEPRFLSVEGVYKFCASAIYPSAASAEDGVEYALQFFELADLRVEVRDPVYAIFSLNRTRRVTVEQGQEWALPIRGSHISNHSRIRFVPFTDSCDTPMRMGEPDIAVKTQFDGFYPFGDRSKDVIVSPSGPINQSFYVSLEQQLLRNLIAPADYRLCFKPNRATNWTASTIVLTVLTHVRRPTRYDYFAADGSEDVVAMTALAPTKLALPGVTGESDTVNIVGALDRQVSVALWCGSNTTRGSGQAPCGTNRRVMFVKPMDDDSDPCFVDAEAVPTDILRGPYILNDGVLTLPHSLSGAEVDFYPNMTQPWILCLETGPERWREPITPLFQIQYTDVILSGFRTLADNASNSTALFPETTVMTAEEKARREEALGFDRTEAEGNQTLLLHAEGSSQVYYLNGYGVKHGQRIRFGQRCMRDVTSSELDAHDGNVTEAVRAVQGVNNSLWFDTPLRVEDDIGTVLFPQAHLAMEELRALPMCLSTDEGRTYRQTRLSLRVLPSELIRDLPVTAEDAIRSLLADTLVVPLDSDGDVSVSGMEAHFSAALNASWFNQTSLSTDNATNDIVSSDNNSGDAVRLPVGTQIVLSSSCAYNVEQLPTVTISRSANTLSLTQNHTRNATASRLRLCVRLPLGGPYPADEASPKNENEGPWWEGDDDYPVDTRIPLTGYVDAGLYLRVLNVRLASITVHPWSRPASVVESGVQSVLVRRQQEALALSLAIRRGEKQTSTSDEPAGDEAVLSVSDQRMNELLRLLDDPDALVLFSLAELRLAEAGACTTKVADAAHVTTYDRVRATFAESTLNVGGSAEADMLHLVSYLPSPDENESAHVFQPWAPGSLCLSVDGGRHFLEVGVGYITASWAPTLRVHVEGSAEQETEVSSLTASQFTDSLQLYEQTSVYAGFTDTRYDARFGTPTGTNSTTSIAVRRVSEAASQYLTRFTVESLWVGFLNHTGFVGQGELYMPAIRLADLVPDADTTNTSMGTADAWLRAEAIRGSAEAPLVFSAGARWSAQSTGLRLQIDPVHLDCLGSDEFPVTESFVRRVDSGLLLSVPHTCGFGLQDGVSLRLVRANAMSENATVCDEPEVENGYAFNARAVWPRAWAAMASSSSTSIRTEDEDVRAVYIHFPTDLAYVPDGSYRVCVKKTLPYEAAQRAQRAAVYLASPVTITVESDEKVRRIAGLDAGLLAVSQGSNARLTLEGSAVGLPSVPLLIAFATATPLTLNGEENSRHNGTTVSLANGCADVPYMRSPITGDTRLNVTALTSVAADAAVLTAPWLLASIDGQVEIPARYLRDVTSETMLLICYSTDFGLTFRTAGADVGESSDPLLLVVMPPTVTGLAINASAMGDVVSPALDTRALSRLAFNASTMTPSVLHVQRFAPVNSSNHTGSADAQPASVYAPVRASMNDPALTVLAGLPSYYYAPTGAVEGNGIGARSGRSWWADSHNTTTLSVASAAATPTFAGAVAFVRSSVIGQTCSAMPVANATNATLALPIFLMRLDTGRVWTARDEAALAAASAAMAGGADEKVIAVMNPVLQNAVWRNATRSLIDEEAKHGRGEDVISFESLMGRAAKTVNVTGESLLVCLTVDGEHFYSANAALAAPVHEALVATVRGEESTNAALLARLAALAPVSTRATRPLSQRPSTPLWVRPQSADTGSLYMRDVVLHMQLMVRPNLTTLAASAPAVAEALSKGDAAESRRLALEESADALARLQAALSDAIGTEPCVLSVYLTRTGSVVVPTDVDVPSSTTTTTTTVAPANETTNTAVAVMAGRLDALDHVVSRVHATKAEVETAAEAEQDAAAAGLAIPVYVLTVGVTADAYRMNKTNQTRTLTASPDLLLHVVSVLRSNATQYTVLDALLAPSTRAYAASLHVPNSSRAYYVSTVTMNFTLGTGEDLHAVNQTDPTRFPSTPAVEKTWREAFLAIPLATLTADPIPDAPDNTSSSAGWWSVPLLLIFPVLLGVGTYYAYIRFLRVNSAAQPATDTTVTS